MISYVVGNRWGVFSSPRWKKFNLLAAPMFLAGALAFIYGGLATSYSWALAPLLGLLGLGLSLLARTWGWAVAFFLLILTLPVVIALQGV
ncbi:MAG: hypothetical protein SPI83_08340 [Rothia sp. (in: high G+C Gram-positive bacteria)]|nr:hypothetical protein [Rothia sp. (in: high G+C Gram-positive bacteria)]